MKKLYKFKFLQINVSLQKIVIVFVLGLLVASNISVHALSTWGIRGNAIFGSTQMINSTLSGYGDRTGQTIGLSKDGTTLAVGSPQHTFAGTGDLAGKVGVYSWNGSAWALKGIPLYAEAVGDYFGSAISINADGTALVVGAFGSSANGFNAGQVQVFTFSGSAWTQMGVDIEGTMMNQKVGESVDISADGKTIVVGVSDITNVAQYSGEVRVYTWSGTDWVLKGSAISGEAMDDYFGKKVSISADGTIIAASAPNSDTPASEAGSVRVFSWNGSSWVQQGSNINGRAASNYWGSALKLNANGNQLAIGTPYYDNSGTITGIVAIYTWTGSAWTQKGADIVGEGDQYLGNDLALSSTGDTIAIGANGATITNSQDGAVKTYRWSGTVWEMFVEMKSGNRSEDNFGKSVSLSGDGKILAVGASGPDNLLNDGGRAQTYFLTCAGISIAQHPVSQTICGSNQATLSVSISGTALSYLWSNGETTQSIQTNTAGVYTVSVTGSCNNVKSISDPATITSHLNTQITTQPTNSAICNGNATTLSVSGSATNISYLWSNGATTPTITTSLTGTYTATVSGACGNVVSNSAQIINGLPTTITGISKSTAIFPGQTTNLNVTATGTQLQYLWSNGATTAALSNVVAGNYIVTVSGLCGSIVSEEVLVGNILIASSVSGYTHITNFGSNGTSNDKFQSPHGVNVANDGKIYVADQSNHRVSVWTLNGNTYAPYATFGSRGSNTNELNYPFGLHAASDGKIYVGDSENSRVNVWKLNNGTYTNFTTFGSSGNTNNEFGYPHSIAIAPDGKIYVTDHSSSRVSVWTSNGSTYTAFATFGSSGSGNNQFSSPFGISVATDGKIYVADAGNSRISVWTLNGNTYTPFATFGSQGTASNQFSSLHDVNVAADGKIYVADAGNNRISVWTQSGNNFGNLATFSSYGSGNTHLSGPLSVYATADGKIYVADRSNSRISVWKKPATIFYFTAIFDVTAPATFTGTTATLTWPTIPGAATYCIRISKDKSMGTGVKTVCGLTGNSYKYNPNDPNARTEAGLEEYFWQVVGVDAEGNESQWSEVQQFSLDATVTSTNLPTYQPTKVSIYPNPSTNGEFRMENGESVTITDVVGKEILSTTKSTFTIASKGIFIARVKTAFGITTLKLVVE